MSDPEDLQAEVAVFTRIEKSLASHEQVLTSMVGAIEKIDKRLNRHEEKFSELESRGPQYANWIAFTSVLITVITIGGYLGTEPTRQALNYLRQDHEHHEALEGHPDSIRLAVGVVKDVERLDSDMKETRNDIKQLDTNLQREMRDLDNAQDLKMENLDNVLQREVRQLNAIQDQTANSMAVEIETLKANMRMDDEREDRDTSKLGYLESTIHSQADLIKQLQAKVERLERFSPRQ